MAVKSRPKKLIVLIVGNIVVAVLLLAVLEGAASFLILGRDMLAAQGVAESRHSEYDPDIGWISLPNIDIPDMYGPGMYVRSNAQRFRNDGVIAPQVPAGRIRLICSGDSFTFGYGVNNAQAWCAQLAALEPKLESVNLGMGGYGVDQAYLWYKKAMASFDHDLHILAFITQDFRRMQYTSFIGYQKPVLRLEGGQLVAGNTPVPKRAGSSRFRMAMRLLPNLNMARVVSKGMRTLRPAGPGSHKALADADLEGVVAAIVRDLDRINREKKSQLVLVYMPVELDYTGPEADSWRPFMANLCNELKIPYIDLVSAMRQLPPSAIKPLFIQHSDYPGAGGHFTEAGNRFAAEQIMTVLRTLPALASAPKTPAPTP